jgi:hypothetical protein
MRYPQGGGLTPERQAFRERIRLEAAERELDKSPVAHGWRDQTWTLALASADNSSAQISGLRTTFMGAQRGQEWNAFSNP